MPAVLPDVPMLDAIGWIGLYVGNAAELVIQITLQQAFSVENPAKAQKQ
jgi:hypothetical protein